MLKRSDLAKIVQAKVCELPVLDKPKSIFTANTLFLREEGPAAPREINAVINELLCVGPLDKGARWFKEAECLGRDVCNERLGLS